MVEEKRNVLITGATSGLGKAFSEYLVKDKNFQIYGIGRDSNKIIHLINEPNFEFVACDLSETENIAELFSNQLKDVKFSGFVHCAGMEETLPISLYTPQKTKDIFAINVFSAFEILRLLSKKKHSLDSASFILVSSIMSEYGQAGKTGYCASKAALLGLTKSLALELAKRKIRVNAVSPGIVLTPLTEKLFQQLDQENIAKIEEMHPLGFGQTNDIVHLLDYLLLDNSKWVTGQNFKIDGGYSIQ